MKLKFKFVLMLVGALLLLASGASAAVVDCSAQAWEVLDPGFSCSFGGQLLFSNFVGVPHQTGPARVTLVTATGDSNGEVFLTFDPHLTAGQDMFFYFQVTGSTNGADLALPLPGTAISEVICPTPINMSNNMCSPQDGVPVSPLLTLSAAGPGADPPIGFKFYDPATYVNKVYIFKNVNAGTAVDFSSFTESFHVPEPVSLVLLGSGLLALGVLRRRRA